uniref:CSON011317 protein n=1 Tax=Culicoides sonorensis TaxID=179676 RepID=A0A336K559_CULSO
MSFIKQISVILKAHPITRGILSYSIIWPSGCFVQQLLWNDDDEINWSKCLRFCMYGGLFVAPTLYAWVRLSTIMFPQPGVKSAIAKALIEQISYTPFAMTCFYFGMSLMEGKNINEAAGEVKSKFLPTYKVALSVWPAVAFINFAMIPEKNRVPFISCCSLLWSTFLAYMKHLESETNFDKEKKIIS